MWFAIIFNAIYFMALHLGNSGVTFIAMLDIAVIGVSYSIAVCFLDSLWMPMAMHTAWNYTQNYIFGLPNSGMVSAASILKLDAATATSSFFYDTGFGVEGTLVATTLDALVGAVIIWYVIKHGKATLKDGTGTAIKLQKPAMPPVHE